MSHIFKRSLSGTFKPVLLCLHLDFIGASKTKVASAFYLWTPIQGQEKDSENKTTKTKLTKTCGTEQEM